MNSQIKAGIGKLKTTNFIVGVLFLAGILSLNGCQRNVFQTPPPTVPTALRDVPALRLNYRFESDVPAPTVNQSVQTEEKNAAVQTNFDTNRPQELLDKTLTSPDKQRILAVYHLPQDLPSEFRLDMYRADGVLLRKITYDGMAVHFADTIVWSPDSSAVAFVAMIRSNQPAAAPTPNGTAANTNSAAETDANAANTENTNVNANAAAPPTVDAPKPVLTFRTEQLYLVNSEGADLKPLTQKEGLIYFYFSWSPDSSALAALAATYQEWNLIQYQAETKSEQFTPQGRPRLIEKNGRERLLDDNLTLVRPVWSPDSSKIAAVFDLQVRIYDFIGNAPTQASIPLLNQLLISSKAFDENLKQQEQTPENANAPPNVNQPTANTNQAATTTLPATMLPDKSSLVSFNPIISLEWTADEMLYVQTGYIKLMKNETDSARSYLRWHRLIFSPQAGAVNEK